MVKKMGGIFISFEGTEGSGKSTLIRYLTELLQKEGWSVTQTREPGGSPIAEKIRQLVLESTMDSRTELFLYEAARSEHIEKTIRPALHQNHIVLCDRFTASTLAYQAHARGLPWKQVQLLNQVATGGIRPDLTVFLDIDPSTGLNRVQDPNRFEAEGLAFQKRVRQGYLKVRRAEAKRWLTLQVDRQTPEQLANTVLQHLKKRFKLRNDLSLKKRFKKWQK